MSTGSTKVLDGWMKARLSAESGRKKGTANCQSQTANFIKPWKCCDRLLAFEN
jgi:hypothetical protein